MLIIMCKRGQFKEPLFGFNMSPFTLVSMDHSWGDRSRRVTWSKARLGCALIPPAGQDIENKAVLSAVNSDFWLTTTPFSFRPAKKTRGKVFCCFRCNARNSRNEVVYSSMPTGAHISHVFLSAFMIPRSLFSTTSQTYIQPPFWS